MKKYWYIFKSELISELNYVANILFGFIGYFIMLYIFLNLWEYIYSDPNELINGYNMNQMIWYVIITEILWSVSSGRKYCRNVCNDVRSGNVAYNLNKPYSYIGYSLFNHLGHITLKYVIYIILGMLIGFLFIGSFPNITLLSSLCIFISGIFATIISIFLIMCISLLSFFIEDANPFYWLYSKLILIVGVMFPIEYFPSVIQPILKFSPVYVVSYGPAKLFVNFSWSEFINIIIAQIVYMILGYILCLIIYKKGVKKLNVNGG